MLYIAYGSNINRAQMKARCPGAKVYGQGKLKDYQLEFHGLDGDAKATVVKTPGAETPIVIWEFSSNEESIMDRYEGYPHVYTKKRIYININGKKKKCLIYIKNSSPVARPSRKYVNTIRWGYDEFHLDTSYLLDALSKNSEEFYADNIYEVRSIPSKQRVYPIKLSGLDKHSGYDFYSRKPYTASSYH